MEDSDNRTEDAMYFIEDLTQIIYFIHLNPPEKMTRTITISEMQHSFKLITTTIYIHVE